MRSLKISLIILLFIILNNLVFGQEQTLFTDSYSNALAEAQKNGKSIMLYFAGTDWCRPCIQMKKQIFEKEQFKEFAESHLIPVIVDFPRLKKNQLAENVKAQNEMLANKYNNSGVFPLIVFLDSSGKLIETTYFENRSVEEYINYLTKILNKRD